MNFKAVNIIKSKLLKSILIVLTALLPVGLFTINPSPVAAAASFQGGNFYLVSNTNSPAWMDPVNANAGDIVEFHAEIDNLGPDTATNVMVKADLPSSVSGNTLVSTFHVKADNVPEMTDTATVTVPSTATLKSLVYFPGHATLIQHPGHVNSSLEAIGSGNWVSIGDIASVNNAFDEVLFKAQVLEAAAPTATPTPTGVVATPTSTPTPTPTTAPQATPTPTAPPIGGITNNNTNNNANNSTINNNVSQTNNQTVSLAAAALVAVTPTPVAVTPTPTTVVQQLPKTGLPLAAASLAGLLPIGAGLRRFGQGKSAGKEGGYFIWQKRQFFKD